MKYICYYLQEKDNVQEMRDDHNIQGSVVDNVYVVEITETLRGLKGIEW